MFRAINAPPLPFPIHRGAPACAAGRVQAGAVEGGSLIFFISKVAHHIGALYKTTWRFTDAESAEDARSFSILSAKVKRSDTWRGVAHGLDGAHRRAVVITGTATIVGQK